MLFISFFRSRQREKPGQSEEEKILDNQDVWIETLSIKAFAWLNPNWIERVEVMLSALNEVQSTTLGESSEIISGEWFLKVTSAGFKRLKILLHLSDFFCVVSFGMEITLL